MQRSTLVLLCAAVLAGCGGGQTGGETGLEASGGHGHPSGGKTGTSAGMGPVGTGGETHTGGSGSSEPGARECEKTSDCVPGVEARLAALSGPVQNARRVASGECTPASVAADTKSVSGYACDCSLEGSGSLMIGPVGLGCYVRGRAGDCLFDDSDFSGCTLAESDRCQDVCAELEVRLEADAARTFETEVVYTTCEQYSCHSVVKVDGRCYADFSFEQGGLSYDCSLGGKAILDEHEKASSERQTDTVPNESPTEEGTSGFIDISVVTSAFPGEPTLSFSAYAQFFDEVGSSAKFATVLDPLEGVDDCGVVVSTGMGVADAMTWVDIGKLTLIDGSHEYGIEETPASHEGYYSYGVDLTELGVEPRYGGKYGLRGSGGGFGETFSIDGVRLPEALSVSELESKSQFEPGALKLTWSGEGDVPLRVRLWINPLPMDVADPYEIECLMADDGEFTIPEKVLKAAPEGFVMASFRRQNRTVAEAGEKTLTINAVVEASYEFLLGQTCDYPEVAEACTRYAEQYLAALERCDVTDLPTAESLCPDNETQACHVCSEYYDCAAANTMCRDDGLYTYSAGCTCP
ncbi:MAG: hypothetical protein JW940_06220 [Polyangiaceae bacterium]|nr:hypothetical protein [Polyangiaceae bacterium]